MSGSNMLRDRPYMKFEAWTAQAQAIQAHLDLARGAAIDRAQATKWRLRDVLDYLEHEIEETETLAPAVGKKFRAAGRRLRIELNSTRPMTRSIYGRQKLAITAGIAQLEAEMVAIPLASNHQSGGRLGRLIERAVRAAIDLEAEFDALEIHFNEYLSPVLMEPKQRQALRGQVRVLTQAIRAMRRMPEDQSAMLEAEFAAGITQIRKIFGQFLSRKG